MDEVRQAIVERVSRDAATWFPGTAQPTEVHLRPVSVRRRSRVYAVSVGDATAPPVLVAKVRSRHSATGGGPGGPRRPTLAPAVTSEQELTALEFAGLAMIEAAVAGEPGLGAIRPLAHLAGHDTILMGYVSGTTGRDLLVRASRLHPARLLGSAGVPDAVLPRVGSWLRTFHDAVPLTGHPVRQETGRDVVAHFSALEEFLGRCLGARFGDLAGAGSSLAAEALPAGALPHVVGHGDFAPRNVLLAHDGRLVVFDPLVRWAVPAQEDLCRFLVGMRLLGLQLHSHGVAFGPARLEHWERLVIEGYGEPAVTMPSLRCYQLLILLDKWSALVDPASTGGARAAVQRRSLELAAGYLRAQAERVLELARSAGG